MMDLYGVSLLTINYLSMSFMIIYVPMNFPSTYVLDKYGMRTGVLIGMVGLTMANGLRCLINQSFLYVILGSTLAAVFQPFVYNAPAKVTAEWFDKHQSSVATMIGTCANIFGVLVGFLLPKVFIKPKYVKTDPHSKA